MLTHFMLAVSHNQVFYYTAECLSDKPTDRAVPSLPQYQSVLRVLYPCGRACTAQEDTKRTTGTQLTLSLLPCENMTICYHRDTYS